MTNRFGYNKVTDLKYDMHWLLQRQLDMLENATRFDFDAPMIIDGEIEGTGKSVLAQQVAYYLAWKSGKKLTIDHIVFTPNQFIAAIDKAEKRDAIIWDEAYAGNSKYRQASQREQIIQNILMKIRQKNLYIVIVLPYIFDLTSYLGITRTWFLLHANLKTQADFFTEETQDLDYEQTVLIRGFYGFYSRNRKKALFLSGRQEYDYSKVPPVFTGIFPRVYTVDEQAYKDKKLKYALDDDDKKKPELTEADWIKACLRRNMPTALLRKYAKTPDYVYQIKREIREEVPQEEEKNLTING